MKEIIKIGLWLTFIGSFGACALWVAAGIFVPERATFDVVGSHINSLAFQGLVCGALLVLLKRAKDD